MTQTQHEADLQALEAPHVELAHAKHELATIQALIATTPHAGARAAMQADVPAAQARLDAAKAAHQTQALTVSAADIDAAAQRVIDARQQAADGLPAAQGETA